MLVALNKHQELTLATGTIKENSKHYTCPCCRTPVIFKSGPKTIPHFAHKSLIDCKAASESESLQHLSGKLDIYRQVEKFADETQLELYFEEINQRSDIAANLQCASFAFEFQCSNISVEHLTQRTAGYKSIGITPIWIFNIELLKRNNDGSFRINSMVQSSITEKATLLFYDVERKTITRLTEITPFSRTSFFSNKITIPLNNTTLATLTHTNKEKRKFLIEWHNKRTRYIKGIRYEGLNTNFHSQLYESGMYVQNLPAFVGIPLRNNFLLNMPPIEWQGILFIELLKNKTMTKSEIIDLWQLKINELQIVPSETAKLNNLNTNKVLYEFMEALLYTRFATKCPDNNFIFKDKTYNEVPYEKLVKFLSER